MTTIDPAPEAPQSYVAIVGAGLSGLRAAQVLKQSGTCRVRLFDRARNVGGRTSLRRAGPFSFDHGAQYFTARDAKFRAQVDAWIEAGPLTWACRDSAKVRRPKGDAWVLHGSPAWTQAHLDLEPDEVARELAHALGQAAGIPAPRPIYTGAHLWMHSGAEAPREDRALFDADLGLAGDWLNGSKVQGAWLSGQALADTVVAGANA